MPKFSVKTLSGNQIWASPDGQRKIYELVVDVDGKQLKAKTYSDAISQAGWSGEVETYEKENRNGGVDTFVKQPPKENGYSGGSSYSGNRTGGSGYSGKDEAAIKAMWAIGQASTVVTAAGIPFAEAEFYPSVQTVASQLFGMVDKVKTGEAPEDTIHEVDDGPMSLADLDAVIGEQPIDVGETPWPSKN